MVRGIDVQDGIFFVKACAYLGAAIAMGLGSVGPAIGQGMVGTKACEGVGKYPDQASSIQFTMMIALGFIESSAVYCLIIAVILIFFT